jgi:hypothetical protein
MTWAVEEEVKVLYKYCTVRGTDTNYDYLAVYM